MDPVTHALIGSSIARVALSRSLAQSVWIPGAVGALLPDVDALVRSSSDPLLYAEFHRHFTHALAFIPAGGAIAAAPWLLRARTRRHWKTYLGAATAGYATHGVLDASTTYGTVLFWPIGDIRVAWNLIAIVDPLFTLAIAVGVAAALWRRSPRPAAAALLACALYLTLGAVQRERAREAQAGIAEVRGHDVTRGAVFPGFGNNVVWRSLYLAGGTLHMDRIRVPWSGSPSWKPGPQVPLLGEQGLPEHVRAEPRLVRDFRRFEQFSAGWVARAPADPALIGDARYSDALDRFEPVWGIRFATAAATPVVWVDRSRERRLDMGALWDELRGSDGGYRSLQGR